MSVVICNSNNRAVREQAHLAQLMEQRVLGILLTPIDPQAPWIDAVAERGVPLVIVDRTRDDDRFCSVAVDDVLGGRLADRAPHRPGPHPGRVHRRAEIARARSATATPAPGTRLERGRAAARRPRSSCRPAALTVAEGRGAGERLAGLSAARRPTAAFCANDITALGLLQAAIGTGWRVPSDLAIVGYDDIEFASAAAVPLTSVRQPREELGRTAAQLLLAETTDEKHLHQRVVFKPELVARASSLTTS